MEAFQNECKRLGLYYDTKDLYNFHTAMKTGSLVILAGMSGTGKSKACPMLCKCCETKQGPNVICTGSPVLAR